RIPREGTQSGGASPCGAGTTDPPAPIDGSVVLMLLGTAVSKRYSGRIRGGAAGRDCVLSEAAIAAGVVRGARRCRGGELSVRSTTSSSSAGTPARTCRGVARFPAVGIRGPG